jgi:hypothetical protein
MGKGWGFLNNFKQQPRKLFEQSEEDRISLHKKGNESFTNDSTSSGRSLLAIAPLLEEDFKPVPPLLRGARGDLRMINLTTSNFSNTL